VGHNLDFDGFAERLLLLDSRLRGNDQLLGHSGLTNNKYPS
jgi:hypothetical protein